MKKDQAALAGVHEENGKMHHPKELLASIAEMQKQVRWRCCWRHCFHCLLSACAVIFLALKLVIQCEVAPYQLSLLA